MSDVGVPKIGPPEVPNYLVWAILSTICCCLPFGIVSIVYAAQVNGKLATGDYPGALASSANAKRWAWIAFGSGLVLDLIVIVFYAVLIVFAIQAQPPGGGGGGF